MLAGWVRQQRTRFLNEDGTIQPRVSLVGLMLGSVSLGAR
jgi:hypothetical protein